MITPKLLSFAGGLGIASGLCLMIDSAAVDLVGNEDPVPNTVGLLAPLLGVFLLTGVFLAVRSAHPTRLLDRGYALNVIGLMLVSGVDFARNYVLLELDDDRVDALLEAGPTRPAFTAAGVLFVVGAVMFGAALIRRGFARRAAWLYVVTAVPSGLAPALPDGVAAGAQILAGVAVLALGWALREAARATPEGVRIGAQVPSRA